MKIESLKVNGYGKIINKDIELKDKINVIQGKNEAGKSTMLSFINNMFYGASKNKNGKAISDFDKYKPWDTESFSGKIKYTLDNGESYEIYREFKKKNPIIYDKNLEDVSNNYIVDKTSGIDFLNEQIGIDEEIFLNTVVTYQDEIKMSKTGQNTIIQKISNLVSSGDENVSFKKTLDKINKLQNEEVGTNRTVQKPINIVNNRILELRNQKQELENYKSLAQQSDNNLAETEKELKTERNKLELLKAYKEIVERNKIEYAEIDVNRKMELECDEKIEELSDKIDIRAKGKIQKEKKSYFKNYLVMAILFVCAIVSICIKIPLFVAIAFSLGIFIISVLTIKSKNKFEKQKKDKLKELEDLEKRVKQEIDILKSNKLERHEKVKSKEEDLKAQMSVNTQVLTQEFSKKLDLDFIENVFEMNYDELLMSISSKEERVSDLTLRLHTKTAEKQAVNEKLEGLAVVQEELNSCLEEQKELNSLNNSYNIAKECMEIAYQRIRESISPVFTEELCALIGKVSNGKYDKIKFNDTDGLTVEIDDGRYVSADNLSLGTIDQMYLALRLSSLKAISKENMPIILDEAFVYFDDERLKNIISFINKNYEDKQVIIFTCSDREKLILDKLNIEYNLIKLEN